MNQPTDVNPTPLAGISSGVSYFVPNAGPETVYLEVANAASTNTDNAYPLPPGSDLYFSTDAGEYVYAWSPRNASRVVYDVSAGCARLAPALAAVLRQASTMTTAARASTARNRLDTVPLVRNTSLKLLGLARQAPA